MFTAAASVVVFVVAVWMVSLRYNELKVKLAKKESSNNDIDTEQGRVDEVKR